MTTMEKKIYKVYAQCVLRPRGKAITEITEFEAQNLISDAVIDMINNEDIVIDAEDDDEFCSMLDEITTNAMEYFEENEFFMCGDFIVIVSEDFPTRSGSYGWTSEF